MTPRIVLAFCGEGFAPDYTFAYVMAAGHEGRLLKTDFSMFPPQGSIYVPRSLFPHMPFRFRDLGFWDVEEDPNFSERARGAKFRAFRIRSDVPAELLRVDLPSHRADDIREALMERGLESLFRLDGRDLLLEFSDGVVAGPIRVEPVESDGRYRVDPDRLSHPVGAWPSRAPLQPVLVAMGQTMRWFVWPVPRSEEFIDLASTRQVLEHLMRIGMSQIQFDDVVDRLGSIDAANRTPALHRKRLDTLLKEALETGKQLDACVHLLRGDPRMQEAIEEYKRKIGEEYRLELAQTKDRLHDEIKSLEGEKDQLQGELEDMRERLGQEEAEKHKIADSMAETVIARARRAQKDVHALLAEVAVLRPFLAGSAAGAESPLGAETHTEDGPSLAGLDAAFGHLKAQLENVGLQPPSAVAAAREILVALTLGQAVFFQGSLAPLLAQTTARVLTGAHWIGVEVPEGLKDGADMKAIAAAASSESAPSALVLGGVNRSCIDAYAAPLVSLLAERSAGVAGPSQLLLIGVLSDGLTAAPPDPVLSALGPILHTDYLAWKRAGKPGSVECGQLTAWDWPHRDGPDEPALIDLLDALQPAPNEMWRRNVLAAFRRLRGWATAAASPDALASTLFAWVLPRCLAAGVDPGEHADALQELFPDPEEIDPRLQRFLKTHGVEVGA